MSTTWQGMTTAEHLADCVKLEAARKAPKAPKAKTAACGHTKPNANPIGAAWVLTTGKKSEFTLEVDQICGTEAEAKRELKDLKAMGHDDAKMIRCDSWNEAETYQDKVRGY